MVSPFASAPPAASRTVSADTSTTSIAHAPPKLPAAARASSRSAATSEIAAASTPPQASSAAQASSVGEAVDGADNASDAGSSSNAAGAMAVLKQRQRQQLQTRLSATGVAAPDQNRFQRTFAATTGGRPGWDSSELDSHMRLRASPAAEASLRPAAAQLRGASAANSSTVVGSAGKAGGLGSSGTDGAATSVSVAAEDQGQAAASSVFRHGRFASRTAPDEMALVSRFDHMQHDARASCVRTPCWVGVKS